MTMDMQVLKERLRVAFGDDSQETIAKKLNMTQGNISKILKGQQPYLDTIYQVSKIYEVSVDWLLGISEKKSVVKYCDGVTYATATETMFDMKMKGVISEEDKGGKILFEVRDPLLKMLYKKGTALSKVDRELYVNWLKEKLAMFGDRQLLQDVAWQNPDVDFLAGEASTEVHWLEVYCSAKEVENDYVENFANIEGPFGS